MHDKLDTWRDLVISLASRPTHLREIHPFTPTWMGKTDASGSGMGRFCQDAIGPILHLEFPFSTVTQSRVVSSSNPKEDVTINDLDLGALLMQLLLSTPKMAPLEHIHT